MYIHVQSYWYSKIELCLYYLWIPVNSWLPWQHYDCRTRQPVRTGYRNKLRWRVSVKGLQPSCQILVSCYDYFMDLKMCLDQGHCHSFMLMSKDLENSIRKFPYASVILSVCLSQLLNISIA